MVESKSGNRTQPATLSLTRLALRAVVIATAVVASVIAIVPFVDAAVPLDCSVEPAEGGVLLSWTEVPDAVSYQYKRDIAGSGSAYQRVTGNSAFLPVADGQTATVGLSPVFADGSTQARTPCGSASPVDGSGPTPLTCSVASADGGIEVSWNEIDGAVEYAWKLTVEGFSPKYRRVKGTSAFISLSDGMVGSVSVTPVFADGSIRTRSECGSAAPNDGTGGGNFTCKVSSAPNGVLLEWTEVNAAVSYQYKSVVEGKGASYRRVTGSSALIALPSGTTTTVGLSPVFADGSTMPRTNCGTATAGGVVDPPDAPVIGTCGLTEPVDGTARFSWTAENTDDVGSLTWKIVYTFSTPGETGSEVARSFDKDARTYDIAFAAAGTTVTGTIEIENVDGQIVSPPVQVDCGSIVVGVVDPPEVPVIGTCGLTEPVDGTARFSWTAENTDDVGSLTWRIVYTFSTPGETGSEVARSFDKDARSYDIAFAAAGTTVTGTIEIENVDGQIVSPPVQVDCGSIVVGVVDPPIAPVITSCSFFDQPDGTGNIGWTAENTGDLNIVWAYVVEWREPNNQFGEGEGNQAFGPDSRTGFFALPAGTIVTSASIRIESINNLPPEDASFLDCGTHIVGGVPGGPWCIAGFGTPEMTFEGAIYEVLGYEMLITASDGTVSIVTLGDPGTYPVTGTPGDLVDVEVRAELPDGTYSLLSLCGQVQLPDDPGGQTPLITSCGFETRADGGIDVVWTAENTGDLDITWSYEYTWLEPNQDLLSSDIGRAFGPDERSVSFFFPEGTTITRMGLAIDAIGGDPIRPREIVECGSAVVGGVPGAPLCRVVAGPPDEVFFFGAIYEVQGYEFVITYDNGDVEVFPVAGPDTYPVPGRAGEEALVSLRAVLPDGSNSLTSICGRATIPDGPAA